MTRYLQACVRTDLIIQVKKQVELQKLTLVLKWKIKLVFKIQFLKCSKLKHIKLSTVTQTQAAMSPWLH